MRATLIAGLIGLLIPTIAVAQEPAPAPAPARGYSTSETPIGTLLEDPAAREILAKYLPQFLNGGEADKTRPLTLKAIQQVAPTIVTDKVLADIDTDLARLPKK